MKHSERDNERIVELTSVSTVFAAEALVAELKANEIPAMVAGDSAGGMRPSLGYANGYRVMVFETDIERAGELIEGVDS